MPPVTCSVAEYGVPTPPSVSVVVVTATGEIEKPRVAVSGGV